MAMISVWLKMDGQRLLQGLQEASEKLDGADGELMLDFSSVHRMDPRAVRAMEKLAGIADAKAVKVALRGVNVGIYKVLKLARVAPRFSFVA